jgi:hypothetical protein
VLNSSIWILVSPTRGRLRGIERGREGGRGSLGSSGLKKHVGRTWLDFRQDLTYHFSSTFAKKLTKNYHFSSTFAWIKLTYINQSMRNLMAHQCHVGQGHHNLILIKYMAIEGLKLQMWRKKLWVSIKSPQYSVNVVTIHSQ